MSVVMSNVFIAHATTGALKNSRFELTLCLTQAWYTHAFSSNGQALQRDIEIAYSRKMVVFIRIGKNL